MTRLAPELFHPPIGTSDEAFHVRRRWIGLLFVSLLVLAAAVAVALRP